MPTPILPDLQPLTANAKDILIQKCNSYSNLNVMLHYLQTGELTFEDMPNLNDERKKLLMDQYNEWKSTPEPVSPEEQQMWTEISAIGFDLENMDISTLTSLESKLNDYINRFDKSRPGGNHVDEAKGYASKIKQLKEKAEWENVDFINYDAIKQYLLSHPNTSFFFEAEGYMWNLIKDLSNIQMVQTYVNDMESFANLKSALIANYRSIVDGHIDMARTAVKEYWEWQPVKNSGDIEKVWEYINNHPNSPFKSEIWFVFDSLKRDLLKDFKQNLSKPAYVKKYNTLTNKGIISNQEFINANIITNDSIIKLNNKQHFLDNHPIDQNKVVTEAPDGHTDVFLFGIPSTGKTCLLMGLLGSKLLDYDSQKYGGDYGETLTKYRDAGITPNSTNENFVSLISGTLKDGERDGVLHNINIIDMGGEAFSDKIADNPEGGVTFEDMGIGATELLSNKNDKVFFIIVDPTVEIVEKVKEKLQLDSNGNPIILEDGTKLTNSYITYVNQKSIIKKFVDLFKQPENNYIMERVKAIHFVCTKADMLEGDREEIAKERVKIRHFAPLGSLLGLCSPKKYAINPRSNYKPMLYTFSLGKFYLGGVFDYDSYDSDKILNVVRNVTKGKREENFLDKIKSALNKPIL